MQIWFMHTTYGAANMNVAEAMAWTSIRCCEGQGTDILPRSTPLLYVFVALSYQAAGTRVVACCKLGRGEWSTYHGALKKVQHPWRLIAQNGQLQLARVRLYKLLFPCRL